MTKKKTKKKTKKTAKKKAPRKKTAKKKTSGGAKAPKPKVTKLLKAADDGCHQVFKMCLATRGLVNGDQEFLGEARWTLDNSLDALADHLSLLTINFDEAPYVPGDRMILANARVILAVTEKTKTEIESYKTKTDNEERIDGAIAALDCVLTNMADLRSTMEEQEKHLSLSLLSDSMPSE